MDDLNSTGTYFEYEFSAFPHRCFRRREIVFAPLSGLTIFLRSIDRQTDRRVEVVPRRSANEPTKANTGLSCGLSHKIRIPAMLTNKYSGNTYSHFIGTIFEE